jgi:hypothetical protein
MEVRRLLHRIQVLDDVCAVLLVLKLEGHRGGFVAGVRLDERFRIGDPFHQQRIVPYEICVLETLVPLEVGGTGLAADDAEQRRPGAVLAFLNGVAGLSLLVENFFPFFGVTSGHHQLAGNDQRQRRTENNQGFLRHWGILPRCLDNS